MGKNRSRLWIAMIVGLPALCIVLFMLILQVFTIPAPGGAFEVGRQTLRWEDAGRDEALTNDPSDRREIVIHLWYPAKHVKGLKRAGYLPDLGKVAGALRNAGEMSALQQLGISYMKSHAFADAAVLEDGTTYPVILFSPGNATNVGYYSFITEFLASQGYVVAGLDHPYDAGAVLLASGVVAGFANKLWEGSSLPSVYENRVEERVRDFSFVIDALSRLNADQASQFYHRLDLQRIGAAGHSVGGVAAGHACRAESRIQACLNLDGLIIDGIKDMYPFLPGDEQAHVNKPFLFLTKKMLMLKGASGNESETRLLSVIASFSSVGERVLIEHAQHETFSDIPLITPKLSIGTYKANRRMAEEVRERVAAFFRDALKA